MTQFWSQEVNPKSDGGEQPARQMGVGLRGQRELVGLGVVGRRLPGSSVFPELPREVNGRS